MFRESLYTWSHTFKIFKYLVRLDTKYIWFHDLSSSQGLLFLAVTALGDPEPSAEVDPYLLYGGYYGLGYYGHGYAGYKHPYTYGHGYLGRKRRSENLRLRL